MKTEKMTYEKPTVQKVEFDFKTRIAGSSCGDGWHGSEDMGCTFG